MKNIIKLINGLMTFDAKWILDFTFSLSVWKLFVAFTFLNVLNLMTCNDDVMKTNDLGNISGVWQLTTTIGSNNCGQTVGDSNTDGIVLMQCGDEVQIIMRDGIWGSGTVKDNKLDFTSTDIQIDSAGCRTTYVTTGSVSGTSSLLEGTFTTVITSDSNSCGTQITCTIENIAHLSLTAAYESSCMDRDEFGDPADSDYILPWPTGKSYKLTNSYCLPTGHKEQQAYDFAIPIGDTIVASREGIVRQIKESSPDNGQGSDHNHVMIEHPDGTVGFYAHLQQNGVHVSVGENVIAGQYIALAGHSGTTDIVHLHFGVYTSYPPIEGNDCAVNFRNMDGPLDCRRGLVMGATYTAL